MFCPKCGKENPEGSRICMFCGTPIQAQVPVQQAPQQQAPQAPQGYGVGDSSYGVGSGYGVGNNQAQPGSGYGVGNNQAQPGSGQSVSDAVNSLGQAVGGLARSVSSNVQQMGVKKMGPFTLDFANPGILLGLGGAFLYFLGVFLPYYTARALGESESFFLLRDGTALGILMLVLSLASFALVLLDNKIFHAAAGGASFLFFMILFFVTLSDYMEAREFIRDYKDLGFKGISLSRGPGFVFLLLGSLALMGGAALRFIKEGLPKLGASQPGVQQPYANPGMQQQYGNPGVQQPVQSAPVNQGMQQPMQQQPGAGTGMQQSGMGSNFNNGQGNA
ncbi:MAG: zinc ribbon domain-containing protein [Lachnospiraceae bacterium]|nr:zinc ribbon domain-containing protein [Lachnospiraceae bacterium]